MNDVIHSFEHSCESADEKLVREQHLSRWAKNKGHSSVTWGRMTQVTMNPRGSFTNTHRFHEMQVYRTCSESEEQTG